MTPLTRLAGDGAVAAKYGVEEAVFLDALMFWWRTNKGDDRNFRDGRWWSHNSIKAYVQVFPWWSAKQIRRIIDSCKAKGAVVSGNYNRDGRDRTYWYSPGDELLGLYGELEQVPDQETPHAPEQSETGKCICPNGQMQVPKRADPFAHLGKPLPCTTHVETHDIPPLPPQGGEAGKSKLKLDDDARALLRSYVGKDRALAEELTTLLEVRQAKRAVNSARGIKSLLRELDRLAAGDREAKLLILRQSSANSWKGVFPLKGASPPRGGPVRASEEVPDW